MPGKILGLDIGRDAVTAVQIASGFRKHKIIACGSVIIREGGLGKALESISRQMDIKSDTYSASIPGEDTSIRNLIMPFSDPNKIKQALPFEIETMSPFPLDELILDFSLPFKSKQSEVLTISAKKTRISEYLSILNQFGIDPEILDIDPVSTALWLLNQQNIPETGILLDIGLAKNTMVLYRKGHITLIRNFLSNNNLLSRSDTGESKIDLVPDISPEQIESCLESFCKQVQTTLHSFRWQSDAGETPEKVFYTGIGALYPGTGKILSEHLKIPAEQIDVSSDKNISMDHSIAGVWKPALMDGALSLALRESRKGRGFNLRKNEFETRKHNIGLRKELRKASVFIILILIFLAADAGIGYNLLKNEYDLADMKLAEIFRNEFPEETKIIDPVQQAKNRINEIKTASVSIPAIKTDQGILDLLVDISRRVPENLDIHITNMVADMESVRISGETDSFNTVDSLKSGLELSGYFTAATISSANLDRAGERVQFEIKLQRVN